MQKISKSDQTFWQDHGIDPGVSSGSGMLLEQIAEILNTQIQAMSPDEKAILRARMLRRAGLIKPKGGKPSSADVKLITKPRADRCRFRGSDKNRLIGIWLDPSRNNWTNTGKRILSRVIRLT